MTFQDLEQKGMVKIIKHLSKLPDKENNKGLRNSTINKVISVTKSFVRWAIQNNYCSNNKFVTQRQLLKSSKRTVVYLEWPELMRVYNYDFSKNTRLGQARDVFCFCCFTSLRYSDVFNLRRSDIIGDSLHLTTIKTSTAIVIELNKYSKAILEKYSKCEFPDDKALPVISNQRMNDYIKEIGCICQINTPIKITSYKGTARIDETFPKWELLSSHAGRRTFICNALILGIPRDIVMKWTGHSDYKAMEPYIEIADKAKRNAMALFDGIN